MHAIPAILFIFVNVAAAHPPGEHADALDQTHIQSFATHDQNSIHVWRDERNKRDLEGRACCVHRATREWNFGRE